MISVIVIGKNEGWKLTRCLNSVYEVIRKYPDIDFEVIYVDSKSSDDSVDRARKFAGIKIFSATGLVNAASGRNIGALESQGEILFFIDGDMEIDPEFIHHAIDINGTLFNSCITGHLIDYQYDSKGKLIGQFPRTFKAAIPDRKVSIKTCGGIFLISRILWKKLGGMRTKYKRSQDLDLTLRLSRQGYVIKRYPHLIAIHHTISYNNETRMWSLLYHGYSLYTAMLTRDHIVNRHYWQKAIRSLYSAILLAFCCILSIIYPKVIVFCFSTYVCVVLIRQISILRSNIYTRNLITYFFERIIYQFLYDISFLFGIFLFFPRNHELSYRRL